MKDLKKIRILSTLGLKNLKDGNLQLVKNNLEAIVELTKEKK